MFYSIKLFKLEYAWSKSGLPDHMNKLSKFLTTLFVFLYICLLFSLFC